MDFPLELRARDVARALDITKRRAIQLMVQGIIPGRKLGGVWMVSLEQFVDYWLRVLDGEGLMEWLGQHSSTPG